MDEIIISTGKDGISSAEKFINKCIEYVEHWEEQDNMKSLEKLEGLLFSILCIIDGVSDHPHVSLVIGGISMNSFTMLHELYGETRRGNGKRLP